jgi:mono/diheme cytochrome c family protein
MRIPGGLLLTWFGRIANFRPVMQRIAAAFILFAFFLTGLVAQDAAKSQSGKGPLPHTKKSIELGKQVYLRNCVQCHDRDGRSLSGRDFTTTAPADLTDPDMFIHGKTPQEIFGSIREGTKEEMPPYKSLRDDEIWNMANFIRNLWPESVRPKVVDEP